MKYTAQQIKEWSVRRGPDLKPARSLNHTVESIRSRLCNAWGVLIGRYDALDWEEQND